jgi:hypothetical protein
MQNLLMLSAAASVLALGMSTHQAVARSPSANTLSPQGLVQRVQKGDEKAPARTAQGGADRGARDGGGKGPGPGATQDKGDNQGIAKDKTDRSAQTRSGDKRSGQQRTNVDVNVDRGRRGYRDRADSRTRVDIDVDRRRRSGARDVGVYGRGYGYTPVGCQDLLRRYKQCIAR